MFVKISRTYAYAIFITVLNLQLDIQIYRETARQKDRHLQNGVGVVQINSRRVSCKRQV